MSYTIELLRPFQQRISESRRIGNSFPQASGFNRGVLLVATLMATLVLPGVSFAAQVHDNPAIELSGFSVSEAFKIPENEPFDLQESNFQKLLYRALQTSVGTFEKYARFTWQVTWEQIHQQNPEHRTAVFHRTGTVNGLERLRLPETEAGDPIREVFRLFCQTEQGRPFQIISLEVPRIWLGASDLRQPIGFTGFLYTLVAPANEASPDPDSRHSNAAEAMGTDQDRGGIPVFVCKQVAWYPVNANPDLGLVPSHIAMAEQGVDIAGIDLVKRQHGKKLTAIEAPCFFQILEAVPRLQTNQFSGSLDAMELLRNFRQAHGQPVRFQARVRQCAVVQRTADSSPSSDPPAAGFFPQYYQLIVFPDLTPSQAAQTVPWIPLTLDVMPPIEVTDEGKTLTYSRFPFTICARSLPEGLSPAEIENQQIWVEGIFYRFWKYESEYTNAQDASGQLSPLILVNQPRLVEVSDRQLNQFLNALLAGFLAIFLVSGWTVWRLTRRGHGSSNARESGKDLPDRLDIENFD